MPYHIRKIPNKNLYKVYNKKGKSLSHKGLTYKNARKQIIAVHLSEVKQGRPYDVFKKTKKHKYHK